MIGVVGLVVVGSAGLGLATRVAAQGTRADQDVLPALLVEVRGLRAAMEQMASAGPQVQLALGRLQLQEQRVNNLVRRMEGIQNELTSAVQESDKVREELARMENGLKMASGEERVQLEAIMPQLKAAHARAVGRVQRLQTEEAGLNQELATEQGRWTEINHRMEELERALTRK